jgi:hypothetical protein
VYLESNETSTSVSAQYLLAGFDFSPDFDFNEDYEQQ